MIAHGKLCPVLNDHVEVGCACLPWHPLGRCHVTGNPCGTDTWMNDFTCPCPGCQAYLATEKRSTDGK